MEQERRYADSSVGKGTQFFIHAPPLLGKRKSKRKAPNVPFVGAATWQTSIYYFWWEYLRRSDAYRGTCANGGKGKLAKLYEDFGDVHDEKGTLQETFWSWWKEHAHLFWEEGKRRVCEIGDVTDAEETDLHVRLPLNVRANELVKQVRQLLADNEHKVQQARKASRARYPVHVRLRLSALHEHLKVYDAAIANPNHKQHEIADLAGVMVDEALRYDDGDGGKTVVTIASLKRDYEPYGDLERIIKRRKTQAVSTHLKAARDYIRNVEKGFFPKRS